MLHTSRRLLAALLLSACVLALPACDSNETENDRPEIEGDWQGSRITETTDGEEVTLEVEMSLEIETSLETRPDIVNGTAVFAFSDIPDDFSGEVSGTYDYPNVSLDIQGSNDEVGVSLGEYEGEITESGGRMEGTFGEDSDSGVFIFTRAD